MRVDASMAIQRCLEWVRGFEMGLLRRRLPRAHAWHTVTVNLVVTADGDHHSADIVVNVRNARTGDTRTTMPHESGWCASYVGALGQLASRVFDEAARFGVRLFEQEEPVPVAPVANPIIAPANQRVAVPRPAGLCYPTTLFGIPHSSVMH